MCVCTANWVKACMLFQGMIMISLNPNWFPYQKTGTEIAYSGKLVSDILQAINTIPEIQTFKFTECFHFSILWHLLLCLSYQCVHEDFPIGYDTTKVVPYIQEYHVCGFVHLVSSSALLL